MTRNGIERQPIRGTYPTFGKSPVGVLEQRRGNPRLLVDLERTARLMQRRRVTRSRRVRRSWTTCCDSCT